MCPVCCLHDAQFDALSSAGGTSGTGKGGTFWTKRVPGNTLLISLAVAARADYSSGHVKKLLPLGIGLKGRHGDAKVIITTSSSPGGDGGAAEGGGSGGGASNSGSSETSSGSSSSANREALKTALSCVTKGCFLVVHRLELREDGSRVRADTLVFEVKPKGALGAWKSTLVWPPAPAAGIAPA